MSVRERIARLWQRNSQDESLSYRAEKEDVSFYLSQKAFTDCESGKGGELLLTQYAHFKVLEEQGLAERFANGFALEPETVVNLESDLRLLFGLPDSWPGSLELRTQGSSFQPSFRLRLRLRTASGDTVASYRLEGPFLRLSETEQYLPSPNQWLALKAVADHQALVDGARSEYRNLLAVHHVQKAAEADCDIYLRQFTNLKTVEPERVSVSLEQLANGDLELTPNFEGLVSAEQVASRLGQIAPDNDTVQSLRVGDTISICNLRTDHLISGSNSQIETDGSRLMTEQRIILGDALSELPKLESETFDLIIADPPYNLGKNYGNNHDVKGFDEYLEFSQIWLKEAHRLLKPQGTIYVFMGFRFISYLYDILERELAMFFNSWIVWHYTQGMGKTKGFSPRHDDILMFTKSKDFVFNLNDVRVPQKYYRERNNMRGANPGDVWEFSHVHYCNEDRQNHPTQKPEGLIERMVLASSNERALVLDPFFGSGTTLQVCQQLNRFGTGIELNPDYVQMSQERLQKEFSGFDSVDPRMKRVPFDLRTESVRQEYLENHKRWFLSNHENSIRDFEKSVETLYQKRTCELEQMKLFESNKKRKVRQGSPAGTATRRG